MNPQTHRRTGRTISSLGLCLTMLMTCHDLTARSCCRIWLPQVRFQPNSVLPVDGELDFGCVRRRRNADSTLAGIARVLRDNPTMTMALIGHADRNEDDVEVLSLQRARRMACALVSTHGIEAARLTVEGKGDALPRIDEPWMYRMSRRERLQARQYNRRVEFRVTGYDRIPPHLDELAAVRFLSDPAPPMTSAHAFCESPVASADPVESRDTVAPVETQDTTLVEVEQPTGLSTESRSDRMEATAPMIVPNPIVSDELSLVWLPATVQGLSIRMMTLDGRSIMEQRTNRLVQGARLTLPVPRSLASGPYLLRISDGTQDWSLRFVKP